MIPEIKHLTYEERLKLKLPSLYYRGARGVTIVSYKYTYGFYTVNEPIIPACREHFTRGHEFKLSTRHCNSSTI